MKLWFYHFGVAHAEGTNYFLLLLVCNTGGTCPAVTADQLHCLDNSESTNGDLIKTYCDGVDLDLLKAQKVSYYYCIQLMSKLPYN